MITREDAVKYYDCERHGREPDKRQEPYDVRFAEACKPILPLDDYHSYVLGPGRVMQQHHWLWPRWAR